MSDDVLVATDVKTTSIEEEMRRSYLDYAMSVVVSRALPDVRDGMKPVHRRILYSMYENGYEAGKPYRKSARVVGDVIGKYHPHGDQAVYDALVRMAQDFSMRAPLIDGQGNFGSMDGDPAAAMRYTEVRMYRLTGFLLEDIDKQTVEFQPNYDNQEREPVVLPARFPNILVNGAGGIAVGMATNIPPHNLGEVIDGCFALLENPDLTIAELVQIIPAPDFPTGGLVLGYGRAAIAYDTGRGGILMRGVCHIEPLTRDRQAIIVTEIPYQVNKASLVEKIAEMVKDKRIEHVSDLRDESDRYGVRIVLELRREAVADVVMNQLYRYTPLQSSFGVNMLVMHKGQPVQMSLKQVLEAFLEFRYEVIEARTRFELNKARDRAHILAGLSVAVANMDEVVRLIRSASNPAQAKQHLMERPWQATAIRQYIALIADPRQMPCEDGFYRLSEVQAQAILDLKLHRLTALGQEDIASELTKLATNIEDYLDILASPIRRRAIITQELQDIKTQFATPRRTQIVEQDGDLEDESLIQEEDMVVLVTANGYIMRVPIDTYRVQRRGGKGRSSMNTRSEDMLARIFVASTHTHVLFFSNTGMVYKLKVWRLPLGSPQSRGKALVNLLPLAEGEHITTILPVTPEEAESQDRQIMFATRQGQVRRNLLSDFMNVRISGKIAISLAQGDSLVSTALCEPNQDCILASHTGRIMRFQVEDVRLFSGRVSSGVRGIKLLDGDHVIGMTILEHVDFSVAEAAAYLRWCNQQSGIEIEEDTEIPEDEEEDMSAVGGCVDILSRLSEFQEKEHMLLLITEDGFGKKTSSYAFRVMNRGGGRGIPGINCRRRGNAVIACLPITEQDDVLAVTDGGQIIRFPAAQISTQSRLGSGVRLFRVEEDEKIVSVVVLNEEQGEA